MTEKGQVVQPPVISKWDYITTLQFFFPPPSLKQTAFESPIQNTPEVVLISSLTKNKLFENVYTVL